MERKRIKVVIVEDSKLYQMYLKKVLGNDEFLEVCGCASDGKEARAMIEREKPDVITLDLQLPDVKDFELLQELVKNYKTPIIVVTSRPDACEGAMKLGASDFIEKAQNGDAKTLEEFSLLLRLKIKGIGRATGTAAAASGLSGVKKVELTRRSSVAGGQDIIAVGASLGGTEATLQLLTQLPADMPGIVIVQHMPPGFTKAYAMRLDRNCQMRVKEAENGDVVERGTVIIAKGGEQMTVQKTVNGYVVRTREDEKVGGFCPAVNVLFQSVAAAAGKKAVGVILTGIGRDGAEGLLQMHEAGAYTLGQNEESCVVYGMPREAMKLGAVDRELPVEEISKVLIRHFEG